MLAGMQLLHGLGINAYLSANGRGVAMKSSHHFRDQLSVMSGWFEQWNKCEQTVALFSLIKKIEPSHARFLALVLEQNTQECQELQLQEKEANDPGYISGLSTESKETAVSHLLSHLPLLRPGNREAKDRYLGLIPKILAHSIRHGVHIEESRQLLSYSLIHPAIPNEDRLTLTQWLRQLEDRIHNCPALEERGYSNGLEDRIHNYPPPPLSNGVNGLEDRMHNYPPPSLSNGLEDRMHYPPPSLSNGLEDRVHGYPPPLSNGVPSGPPPPLQDSNFQFSAVPRLDLWRPGGLMGSEGNSYGGLSNLGSNSLPPCIGTGHMALHGMNSAPVGGMSSHPDGTQTLPMPHSRVKRSCSLTPRGSPSSSCEESCFQLNGAHAPLSPQSSVTSSGSGSEGNREERDTFNLDGTGMKDVPCWLKGLRLHKYAYIFKNMTYEEMMSITEEKLEKMNITKGARHKIVLSIQKLCERQSSLRSLEKDIQDGEGTIRSALNEIKGMLQTPIKAFGFHGDHRSNGGESESSSSDPPSAPPSPPMEGEGVAEGDLPGQITRLLGKICSSLLISPSLEEDLNFFGMITDKCLSHEAFTPAQKRRLFTWKQQIQKASHPLPPRRSLDSRQRNKWSSYHSSVAPLEGASDSPLGCGSSSLRRRMPVQFQPPHRMALARQLSSGSYPRNTQCTVIKRPSLQEHMKPHVQIQRTNSAPVRPHPLSASIFGKAPEGLDSNDPELNIRLESLCLSVTEHALGSFDGAVPLF